MFKNNLKAALRNIGKHKLYSAINFSGLAIGIACCLLIWVYVKSEFSYDTFHENAENIYRINSHLGGFNNEITRISETPIPLLNTLIEEFPEIMMAARFDVRNEVIRFDNDYYQGRVGFIDPSFFDVFSFPLKQGSLEDIFRDPKSMLISEEMAQRYFGNNNPIGQRVSVKLSRNFHNFTITGVLEKIPENSSIKFNFLIPFEAQREIFRESWFTDWNGFLLTTFVVLNDHAAIENLETKLRDVATRQFGEMRKNAGLNEDGIGFFLQPLTEIHLDESMNDDRATKIVALGEPVNSPQYSYILIAIGILIIIIGSLNFTNLSLALSQTRSKEIGMRKVFGAMRKQLISQYWGEALLSSFFAAILGVILAELFLPSFNTLANKQLTINYMSDPLILVGLLSITVTTGILSGFYPALFLSGFKPISALKGRLKLQGANQLGKVLIIAQFAVSIFMIVSTSIILEQLDFMRTKDLGFSTDQVIVIKNGRTGTAALLDVYANFKSEITQRPEVINVSASTSVFGSYDSFWWGRVDTDGVSFETNYFQVRDNFIDSFDLQLISGRNFSETSPQDLAQSIIVNEKFVREFNWDNPIGKKVDLSGDDTPQFTIIGVVKDFHFESLHTIIKPALIRLQESDWVARNIYVKINPTDVSGTISFLTAAWNKVNPEIPFDYSFFDESFGQQYIADERWSQIISYASFLAIFIACLGLFGITALILSKRLKEIGIRKVLGAPVSRIIGKFDFDFLKLVIWANCIAWPFTFYIMHQWLESYAFRIGVPVSSFLYSGILTALIVVAIVSTQSLKAALTNPVEILRNE